MLHIVHVWLAAVCGRLPLVNNVVVVVVVVSNDVQCGRYVANKLLEFDDRDQLMKLIERVQGLITVMFSFFFFFFCSYSTIG